MWIIFLCIVGGFLRFGISLFHGGCRVQPSNVKDVVAWRRRMKKSWVLGVRSMVPLTIWWTTWKERNRRISRRMLCPFKI